MNATLGRMARETFSKEVFRGEKETDLRDVYSRKRDKKHDWMDDMDVSSV